MSAPTNRDVALKDRDWVKRTFMVTVDVHNPEKGTSKVAEQNWMYFTEAEFNFVNTSVGGNFTINTLPQFTIFADIPAGGIRNNSAFPTANNHDIGGMGRYYYESIQTWSQKVSFRFGVPEYKGLLTFFTSFYDGGMAILGRTGRAAGIFYLAAKVVGNVVSLPWGSLIFASEAIQWLMGRPPTRYYNLKPTMALYWQRVNLIANMMAANMGIIPRNFYLGPVKIPGDGGGNTAARNTTGTTPTSTVNPMDKKSFGQGGKGVDPSDVLTNEAIGRYSYAMVRETYGDLFMKNGGIDVYHVANRMHRMHEEWLRQLDNRNLTINKDLKNTMKQNISNYLTNYRDPGYSLDKYLKDYHDSRLGLRRYTDANGNVVDVLQNDVFNYLTNQKYIISAGGDPNAVGGDLSNMGAIPSTNGNATTGAATTAAGGNVLGGTTTNAGATATTTNTAGGGNPAAALSSSLVSNGFSRGGLTGAALGASGLALGFVANQTPMMSPGSGVLSMETQKQMGIGRTWEEANRPPTIDFRGVSQGRRNTPGHGVLLPNSTANSTTIGGNGTTTSEGVQAMSDANGTTNATTAAGGANGQMTEEQLEMQSSQLLLNDREDDNFIWPIFKESDDKALDPENPAIELVEGWGKGAYEYGKAVAKGAAEWINFRVDAVRSVSESFQNDSAPSEIQGRINGASSSAAELRFSLSDLQTGFAPLDAVVNGVRDTFAGLADGLHISGLAALMGAGFVDIPQRWTDSSAQFPSASYTIKCRPAYGNILSRFLNMHFVIACLLAGALPISYGRQAYGAPFICEFYVQGKNQSRLAIIESLSITRGEGNLGWTSDGEFLGCDIQFTVKDLSSVMHAPIDAGMDAVFSLRWLISDDNQFNDYMAVLSNLSIHEMTYSWEKLKRNVAQYIVTNQNFLSPANVAMWMGDTTMGRVIKKITPHDTLKIQ